MPGQIRSEIRHLGDLMQCQIIVRMTVRARCLQQGTMARHTTTRVSSGSTRPARVLSSAKTPSRLACASISLVTWTSR